MANGYIVRGIVCLRKLGADEWEVWFQPDRGQWHAVDSVLEFCGSPSGKNSYDWTYQIGASRRMSVGETAHVSVVVEVTYSRFYDHYSGTDEHDVSVVVTKSKLLRKTSMSKRRMKREWFKV